MKYHLITGGAGFVGRNMAKRLLQTTNDIIVVVDDLSVGTHPKNWIEQFESRMHKDMEIIGKDDRLLFFQQDIRVFIRNLQSDPEYLKNTYDLPVTRFNDVFHFAAIVGGRAKIDGDPMMVAQDLSIDAEVMYWICTSKPDRVLFPSSSAAYPVHLQAEGNAIALYEAAISFDENMGMPDMTYGWSKLTGEYLALIAAKYYGISITVVRPMSPVGSGSGEDRGGARSNFHIGQAGHRAQSAGGRQLQHT